MRNPARTYHYQTSYGRHAMSGHFMDRENQPDVFKVYDNIEPITLPEPGSFSPDDLWGLTEKKDNVDLFAELELGHVSRVLSLAYSLTAKVRYPGEDHFYRSVPSAGALYPVEIYLASHNVKGLVPGLYHYGIKDRSLSPLRQQNLWDYVADAACPGGREPIAATLFITGIFFRSAWKYRDRAYRYVLLDAGHVLENLLLALRSEGLKSQCQYDFDDQKLDHLMGIDGQREVGIACVHIFGQHNAGASERKPIESLPQDVFQKSQVARKETSYEGILTLHREGVAITAPQAAAAKEHVFKGSQILKWSPLKPAGNPKKLPGFPETVFRRRSKRNFVNKALPYHKFVAMLDLLCAVFHETPLGKDTCFPLIHAGFIAERIENVESGFYILDPFQRTIGLAASGLFVEKMAAVCLDQEWLRNASVHFLFMIDLDAVHQIWGARGYRYAMLTAGRLGHMINLGAQALGLGSCGIGALYDGEARALLGLTEAGLNLVYLVAAGAVKRL